MADRRRRGEPSMPTYLLEIGTEELPADHVPEAQERLKSLMSDFLSQANVPFEEIVTLGTPRRLACLVKGLQPVQATVRKKVKGPKVQSSFDDKGNALPPAVGFAQKQGVTVDKLLREEVGGVEFLVADVTIEGRPSTEILQAIVPKAIAGLSGERLMRWGNHDLKFSRPIRWLVSLLDKDELPISMDVIKSGRESYGNRVLAPGKVAIDSPESYVQKLRDAKVLVDPAERRSLIEQQVTAAAVGVSGQPRRLSGALLDEVVNILEWPHAVVGEFGHEYLELPDTLIETVMVHHQRYFPVEQGNGGGQKLLPYFITVSNNDRPEATAKIKQGNERVIKARLADGRFFYFDDQKTKLSHRKGALEQLTFQEGLGSYLKKSERMVRAGRAMSDALKLEAKYSVCLERTLELCKLDLVTSLVRELPELQGHVGSWYAGQEGEPPEVVTAIATHYSPRSQDDKIPADTTGRFAAAIDKLDNLTSLFALGRRPSGSSDPYGLRRNAQGLVDILLDGLPDYPVNLTVLMTQLMEDIKPLLEKKRGFDPAKALLDLTEFLLQRVRLKLQDRGYKREVIDAVCSGSNVLENLPDALIRCAAFETLIKEDDQLSFIRAGVRVGNILSADSPDTVNPAVLENEQEKQLWEKFNAEVVSAQPGGKLKHPVTGAEYLSLMELLKKITPEINAFFDNVLVNDPDTAKRNNRHAVLRNIYSYFAALGDFTKLQPLLP
jgi:glycyl-tRNA synthetase beta chain